MEQEKGTVSIHYCAGPTQIKEYIFSFIHTFGKRKKHCPPTRERLTASHKRKKLDFTAS